MYDFSKKKNKKVLAAVVIILVGTMLAYDCTCGTVVINLFM